MVERSGDGQARARTRVVIVDDHQLTVSGLAALLGQHDDLVLVGETGDGAAALDLVLRTRPDVVVLDLLLPNRGGLAVARDLRMYCPDAGVLVLSGSAAEGLQDMLLEMGVRGYLPKTASASEFMAAVRAVAGGMTVRLPGMRRLAEPLTDREMEVLLLVVSGLNNDAIAAEMGIARRTVDTHLTRIFAKTSSRNRGDLAHYALRQGIIPPAVPVPG